MAFKIKRFPPHEVGNRRDSDAKGANEGGDFDRRNFQMSEFPVNHLVNMVKADSLIMSQVK